MNNPNQCCGDPADCNDPCPGVSTEPIAGEVVNEVEDRTPPYVVSQISDVLATLAVIDGPVTVARAITKSEGLALAADLVQMFDPAYIRQATIEQPRRIASLEDSNFRHRMDLANLRARAAKLESAVRLSLRWAVSDRTNEDVPESELTLEEFYVQQESRINVLREALNA